MHIATYTVSGLSNDNATEDETVYLLTSAGSVTEDGVTSHNLHLMDSVTASMPKDADTKISYTFNLKSDSSVN